MCARLPPFGFSLCAALTHSLAGAAPSASHIASCLTDARFTRSRLLEQWWLRRVLIDPMPIWLTVHSHPYSVFRTRASHLIQHSTCVSEALLMSLHCNSLASDADGDGGCVTSVSRGPVAIQYVPSQYRRLHVLISILGTSHTTFSMSSRIPGAGPK
jgi:hypothetical protein